MCKFIKLQIIINCYKCVNCVTMKIIFVSSRTRRTGQKIRTEEQDNRENRISNSVQISVPCELVMGLLSQGAILQMQIGPVPLRPDLVRPSSRPESTNTRPDAANTRPNAANENTRPEAAQLNPRPNPERSETYLTRPERPVSRCPPARPVSLYTDWSSLSDNAEVITIHSEDDDYVPRSPEYEPDSPGLVQETEDWNPTPGEGAPNDHESGPSRTVFSTISRGANETNERPRSPLGRGTLLQRVSPFLRGIGQRRRHQLGRIRPM